MFAIYLQNRFLNALVALVKDVPVKATDGYSGLTQEYLWEIQYATCGQCALFASKTLNTLNIRDRGKWGHSSQSLVCDHGINLFISWGLRDLI